MAAVGTTVLWMLGNGVTACSMIVLGLNPTTGVLDPATPGAPTPDLGNNDTAELIKAATPFRALLDSVDLSYRRICENITPLNRVYAHHYPVLTAMEVVLTEIMRPGHTVVTTPFSNCLLGNAWHAGRSAYVRFTLTRQSRTWTFNGIMTDFSETLVRGKNVGRLTVRMMDSGTAGAPTYA